MRGFRVCAMVLVAFPLVASLCGCGKEDDQPRPEGQNRSASGDEMAPPPPPPPPPGARNRNGAPHADTEGAVLGNVLASWESGKKEEALKQLLSVRWDGPGVFADVPNMNLSEKDFGALPADERDRIGKELMELTTTLRSLARHANSIGDNAQASGDKQTAKAHYEAVLHLAQAMSSPEHVLLIQQVGKGIAGSAQTRLSAVE